MILAGHKGFMRNKKVSEVHRLVNSKRTILTTGMRDPAEGTWGPSCTGWSSIGIA